MQQKVFGRRSNDPLVSIITLVFNNAKFVREAIQSVLAQTYSNWELLINDDGSTDGAWEIACEFARQDTRIKPYKRRPQEKPTSGWSIASNRLSAYKRSSGELVCHLDGDDMLYPHSIQNMVEHFVTHPEDGMAYSDFAWIDKDSNVFGYHKTDNYDTDLSKFSWRHLCMYRRSAYETTNGYNLELNGVCEDVDLFMQIAEKHKFNRVPHVLYQYRAHENNVTTADNASCHTCTNRDKCNFIRVWGQHLDPNFDYLTWGWKN